MPVPLRTATPVKRKPSWDFSVPGLMYCSVMMFMGIAAMNTQANLLFGVFGLMIGVLLVSGVVSRLVLARLTVRRNLPDAAVVGQPAMVGYEFANGKRFWPSLSVQVAELDGVEAFRRQPHAYLLHAARGAAVPVKVEVTPKRRGVYRLFQYQIATSFPFGFVKRAVVRTQEDSLLVFPPLARVDGRVLRLLRSAETAGVTVKPRRGGEDEVFGLKEYRPGENPRLIHWRRSARTLGTVGQLVAREMTRVSPPRVMLIVDTHTRSDTPEDRALVERTIAVAASLASAALEQGLLVGLVTPGVWPGASEGGYVTGGFDLGPTAAWTDTPPPDGDDAEPTSPRPVPTPAPASRPTLTAARPSARKVSLLDANRGKRHRKDVLSALARLGLNRTIPTRTLIEESMRYVRTGTTPVLVTPFEVEQGLGEQARGALVVLAVNSPMVLSHFHFPPDVDFNVCMPADQQPAVPDDVPGPPSSKPPKSSGP